MSPVKVYLVVYLLLVECHEDHWDEEIEHHKRHEHDAGTEEQSTEHRGVIQDLANSESVFWAKTDSLILTEVFYLTKYLFSEFGKISLASS